MHGSCRESQLPCFTRAGLRTFRGAGLVPGAITDGLVEDKRMTSINILIGVHLTMILCLLMQLGD